jgi:hypothetical protein
MSHDHTAYLASVERSIAVESPRAVMV